MDPILGYPDKIREAAKRASENRDKRLSLKFFEKGKKQIEGKTKGGFETSYYLGCAYYANGEVDKAVKELEYFMRKQPRHDAAHVVLTILYIELGRRQDALKHYLQVSPAYPLDPGDKGRFETLKGKLSKKR